MKSDNIDTQESVEKVANKLEASSIDNKSKEDEEKEGK